VDVIVPVTASRAAPVATPVDVSLFRSYLADRARQSSRVTIPDDVAQTIQDDFVASRQEPALLSGEIAADRLKRRIRIARLVILPATADIRVLAQANPEVKVTQDTWQRAVALEDEVRARLEARSSAP